MRWRRMERGKWVKHEEVKMKKQEGRGEAEEKKRADIIEVRRM